MSISFVIRIFFGAFITILTTTLAYAQNENLVWAFDVDASARTTTLRYHVPETDNIAVYGFCDIAEVPNGSRLIMATDIGNLIPGSDTKVRLSGNGQEYEFPANVEVPISGEGIVGVRFDVTNNHPIWSALALMQSVLVQIPGYAGNVIPTDQAGSVFSSFIMGCSSIAQGKPPIATVATATSGQNNGLTEREAFGLAEVMNSPEGWSAFLKVYPQGFLAEVAKGYLAKQIVTQAPTPPPIQQAQPLIIQRGSAPWYNFNYAQDEGNTSSYAAGVRSGGVEFFAWCGSNRMVNFGLRGDGSVQPAFDNALRAAVDNGQPMQFTMQNGLKQNRPVEIYGLTGEVGFPQQVSPNSPILERLMADAQFSLNANPFASTFQLTKSRVALCNVINSCGAIVAACQTPVAAAPPVQSKPKETSRPACRSRSVYVEGRGCILKKYINNGNKTTKQNSCPSGQKRFKGSCLYPAEIANYCGPGFKLSGDKCVHQNDLKKKSRVKMLKRNEGGFISLDDCRRNGMIEEFATGYCIEND